MDTGPLRHTLSWARGREEGSVLVVILSRLASRCPLEALGCRTGAGTSWAEATVSGSARLCLPWPACPASLSAVGLCVLVPWNLLSLYSSLPGKGQDMDSVREALSVVSVISAWD